MRNESITAEELRELFHYDEHTGIVTRKKPVNRMRKGDLVGTDNGRGYLVVSVRNRLYYLHRIIWVIMTGEWPTKDVDHRNRRKNDNRWCNLRDVSRSVNLHNSKLRTTNKTGQAGIQKRGNRYRVQTSVEGLHISLGSFSSMEEASRALYDYHGEE